MVAEELTYYKVFKMVDQYMLTSKCLECECDGYGENVLTFNQGITSITNGHQ